MKFGICVLFIGACYCDEDFYDKTSKFSMEILYRTQLQSGGHVAISPFGIWTLLTSVAFGATENSYDQLSHALLLPDKPDAIGDIYKNINNDVLDPSSNAVSLTSKNYVFLGNDFEMHPDFKSQLQQDLSAEVLELSDPEAAKIASKYIQLNDVQQSRMIFINDISFKGLWTSPFNKSETVSEPFYNERNEIIGNVNMMHQKILIPFVNVRESKVRVIELSYGNTNKYSMLCVLPYPNTTVEDIYKNFSNMGLKDIFKRLQDSVEEYDLINADLKIPRFRMTINMGLKKPLNDMGVYDIFQTESASFKRITKEGVYVSSIVHKADIEVTEEGTEASAVTEAVFEDKITPPAFHANKPFLYFIMEKTTYTVIFSGIYSKPTVY